MRRLGLLLALGAGLGCGGERFTLDLGARTDGIKLVGLFDADETLVQSFEPVRIEDGRRVAGPRLDLRFDAGLRPIVFELGAEVLVHPRGEVSSERLQLLRAGSASPSAQGTVLSEAAALPPSTGVVAIEPDGRLTVPSGSERTRLLAAVELRREIETDLCPPPLGPFRPVGGAPTRVLAGLEGEEGGRPIRGLVPVDARRWLVLSRVGLALLEDGRPPSFAPGPRPRPWLGRTELGADRLYALAPLGDDELLLAGDGVTDGQVWTVRLEAEGLEVTGTATVGPRSIRDGTRWLDGAAVIDRQGDMWLGATPLGPWTVAPSGRLDARQKVGVDGTADGSLVRTQDESVEHLAPGEPWLVNILAPNRDARVSALWRTDGGYWVGGDRGDLFFVRRGSFEAFGDRQPLLLADCAGSVSDLSRLHVPDTIVGVVELEGYVYAAFANCTGILAHRVEDGCQSVVLLEGQSRGFAQDGFASGLYRVGDGLVLTGADGILYEASAPP